MFCTGSISFETRHGPTESPRKLPSPQSVPTFNGVYHGPVLVAYWPHIGPTVGPRWAHIGPTLGPHCAFAFEARTAALDCRICSIWMSAATMRYLERDLDAEMQKRKEINLLESRCRICFQSRERSRRELSNNKNNYLIIREQRRIMIMYWD